MQIVIDVTRHRCNSSSISAVARRGLRPLLARPVLVLLVVPFGHSSPLGFGSLVIDISRSSSWASPTPRTPGFGFARRALRALLAAWFRFACSRCSRFWLSFLQNTSFKAFFVSCLLFLFLFLFFFFFF